IWHPLEFGVSQAFFLLPSLLIALPLFFPKQGDNEVRLGADVFDRRIIAWLAFGPVATVVAMSAITGRSTVAMWGYPLWLFLGLWLVLIARHRLDERRLMRVLLIWVSVVVCLERA